METSTVSFFHFFFRFSFNEKRDGTLLIYPESLVCRFRVIGENSGVQIIANRSEVKLRIRLKTQKENKSRLFWDILTV